MDDTVYSAVFNPKGEDPMRHSTYLDAFQLKQLADKIAGIPVYINHMTHVGSKEVEPSGKVISARIDPKTGNLVGQYKLFDTKMGKMAKKLQNNLGKASMQEVSIGYDVGFNTKSKLPVYNEVKEVSICWKGAREGTFILPNETIKPSYTIFDENKKNINKLFNI